MINVRTEIESMHTLLPKLKTVGIIFNTAEINSVVVSKIMVTELERIGINPFIAGITSESDIEPAVISALRKVDALIAPTDNTIASAIALISDLARKAEKALIVSDNMLVKHGPLMACGVNYYESGTQAATIALDLLINHKKPYELPIIKPESKSIFINTQTLTALKLTIPDSLAPHVVMVETVE
jgi:putative ABC transport system substrate-binding protein